MGRLLAYLLELLALLAVLRRLIQLILHFLGKPQAHVWSRQSSPTRAPSATTMRGTTARDPVCGMFVSTELSQRLTVGERTLHFCSYDCLERYQKAHA